MTGGPFRVQIDPEYPGCTHCGAKPRWVIVDEKGEAFCGRSYGDESIAEEDCEWFNVAFDRRKTGAMTKETVLLLGPGGQMTRLEGPRGTTPECPVAKFKKGDVVRIRRLKHLRDLPDIAAVAVVIPPNFSPDWAMADLRGKPRPLMAQVGSKAITYIVGFDGNPTPYLIKEKYLLPSGEPPVEIKIEGAP
jgi:hypothetical protein